MPLASQYDYPVAISGDRGVFRNPTQRLMIRNETKLSYVLPSKSWCSGLSKWEIDQAWRWLKEWPGILKELEDGIYRGRRPIVTIGPNGIQMSGYIDQLK